MLLFKLSSLLLLTLCNLSPQASVVSCCNLRGGGVPADVHLDNEFAEFEEFDDDEMKKMDAEQNLRQHQPGQPPPATAQDEVEEDEAEIVDEDDEAIIEDDMDDDFAHLTDESEFENYDSSFADGASKNAKASESSSGNPSAQQQQQLRFADVPAHLRNNWTNYQVELLMLVGLAVYLLNYIYGKTKNQSLAHYWFEAHRDLLEDQFAVVGDDGTTTEPRQAQLIRETDSSFSIWCSGRAGCLGMLIQLKLIKRQDLISIIQQFIKPKYDHVAIRVELDNTEMDSYVFAFGQKKTVQKLAKEMSDLSTYTAERKNADKLGLPESFSVLSEIPEAVAATLDPKVLALINRFEKSVEYVHISDQYTGLRPQEGDTYSKLPEPSRVLVFGFNIEGKLSASENSIDVMKPLLPLVFHCVDKARRFRLSREAKSKAEKHRKHAQETFLKSTHAQRQEQAQAKREEQIRERKQKVLEEEDPEKQRRLEKIENKREAKRNAPRMKQLKVKSM